MFSLSNDEGKLVNSGGWFLAMICDCFGIGRWAFFTSASVLNICSGGGGSLTVLRPFSARALGGGELETLRVFRGDGPCAKVCGGSRRV